MMMNTQIKRGSVYGALALATHDGGTHEIDHQNRKANGKRVQSKPEQYPGLVTAHKVDH